MVVTAALPQPSSPWPRQVPPAAKAKSPQLQGLDRWAVDSAGCTTWNLKRCGYPLVSSVSRDLYIYMTWLFQGTSTPLFQKIFGDVTGFTMAFYHGFYHVFYRGFPADFPIILWDLRLFFCRITSIMGQPRYPIDETRKQIPGGMYWGCS